MSAHARRTEPYYNRKQICFRRKTVPESEKIINNSSFFIKIPPIIPPENQVK